jgi:hypothetical protein
MRYRSAGVPAPQSIIRIGPTSGRADEWAWANTAKLIRLLEFLPEEYVQPFTS